METPNAEVDALAPHAASIWFGHGPRVPTPYHALIPVAQQRRSQPTTCTGENIVLLDAAPAGTG